MRHVLRAIGLAAVITACDVVGPTTLCGCSPPVYLAIMTGTVVDGDGAPAAAARVNAQYLGPARCSDVAAIRTAFVARVDADSLGRFTDSLEFGWQGTTCWGVSASPLGPPWTESDTQRVTIRFSSWDAPDSVHVRLRLR